MTTDRKRARQACHFCNARRIRCNVTENIPCDNCIAAKKPCHIRESRRGKYARRRTNSTGILPRNDSKYHTTARDSLSHADDVTASHLLSSLSKEKNLRSPADRSYDDFEDGRSQVPTQIDEYSAKSEEGSVFLGESSFVRYMQGDHSSIQSGSSPSENGKLLHPVPKSAEAEGHVELWEVSRRQSKITYLKQQGALSLPESSVINTLLQAYFHWFHPCFAIVDEPDIWQQYQQGKLSTLLLQAMLFVGAIYCEDAELQCAGLNNRHQAKYVFYNNAKDLYDAEYETCKVTIIQSIFLLSFRRAGATLEKDARHWLGAAISLSESRAMHRSGGSLAPKKQRLCKRIWWSIYVRERQCAAALGLPNRVRDEDCDIERLEEQDFDHAFNSSSPAIQVQEYKLYAIGMSALSGFLGRIVHCGYLPNQALSAGNRELIKKQLFSWKQELNPAMQLDSGLGQKSSLYANMLHLAYNNLFILLFRSDFIEGKEDKVLDQMAVQAAARNAHIVEDILAPPTLLRYAQIHVITNLFNSLCIHTLRLRRSLEKQEGPRRAISEHQARICLLGLGELQKTWGVENWLLQLFFYYLDESTASRLQVDDLGTGGDRLPVLPDDIDQQEQGMIGGMPQRRLQTIASQSDVETMGQDTNYKRSSWSIEEINNFLYSQIESGFTFGEGNLLNLDSEDSPHYNMGANNMDDTQIWFMGDAS